MAKEKVVTQPELKATYEKWLKSYKEKGGAVTKYVCPHCEKPIECPKPTEDQLGNVPYWDGYKTCPECNQPAYVRTYPNGKTEVGLPYGPVGQERSCRICGCTQNTACFHPEHGVCWWVEKHLCSHCESWPTEAVRFSGAPPAVDVQEFDNLHAYLSELFKPTNDGK